jgi:acid phosphatase (class A)
MKKNLALISLTLLLSSALTAQSSALKPRLLTPISGISKDLVKLSPKALPDATDRQQFPLEGLPARHALKLKLTPQYVTVPPSFFRIGDFPANSSAQTKAEIDYLLMLQNTARSAEKVKESLEFADVYYNVFVKPTDSTYNKMQQNLFHMGRQMPWFTPQNLPKTAALMTRVWSDATYYFWALKFQYNRTRPYMLDSRIKNLDDTNFQAYPSGHASASYVAAYVYQELLPEKTDLLVKNAYDMAHSREILGVHFPSDSESGRVFARQFVNELLKNEAFKRDFEEVKKEIEAVKKANK